MFPMCITLGFLGGSEDKASACNAGDPGSIPGLGRSPGEGNDNPLQYSCLENPMDRGIWRATVHWVAKSWTQLSDWTELKINSLFQLCVFHLTRDFPGGSDGDSCSAGDLASIPVLGRSPGEGNDNPLQYSCLGNPMDRGT